MTILVAAILIAIHVHGSLSDHKTITSLSNSIRENYDSIRHPITSKEYQEGISNDRALRAIKIDNTESNSHLKDHQVQSRSE